MCLGRLSHALHSLQLRGPEGLRKISASPTTPVEEHDGEFTFPDSFTAYSMIPHLYCRRQFRQVSDLDKSHNHYCRTE